MDTKGKRRSRMNWDIGIDVYTLLYIKHISNENLLHSTSVLCVDLNVKGKKKKRVAGGDVYG